MRKDYRQNYRAGTNPFSRKSNIAKIMEVFGVKKKVKKPKKRMMANKGGGADYMNTVKPKKRGNPPVFSKTRENRMGGGMMSRRKFSDGGNGKPISRSKNPGLLAMSKTEKGKEAVKKMKFNPNRIVAKKGGKA